MSAAVDTGLADLDGLQLIRVLLRQGGERGVPCEPDDVMRFRADLGAEFPSRAASAIEAAPARDDSGRSLVRVTTSDFCVGSVLGPLPDAFVEWVRDLDRAGKPGLRDFLDLFNHRLNVLRYAVRAQFELGLNNEAPERTLLAQWIAALMGLAQPEVASRIPLRPRSWLGLGEWLAGGRRTAVGAERALAACLGCDVRLTPFAPCWLALGASNETRLGRRRLGDEARLGRRYWDVQAGVTVDIGPVAYATLLALVAPPPAQDADEAAAPTTRERLRRWLAQPGADLPSHAAFGRQQLEMLLRLLLDRRHDVCVRIAVREREIPASRLSTSTGGGLRLGQSAWLKSRSRDGHLRLGARARVRTARLHLAEWAAA